MLLELYLLMSNISYHKDCEFQKFFHLIVVRIFLTLFENILNLKKNINIIWNKSKFI